VLAALNFGVFFLIEMQLIHFVIIR